MKNKVLLKLSQWGSYAFAALLICTNLAAAQEFQSSQSIQLAIERFLQTSYAQTDSQFEIGKVDPRLRLPNCDTALQVFYPVGARRIGYTSLAVRCVSERSWKIHVPVTLKRFAEIVVSKRPLPRGSYIQASDVYLTRREITHLTSGYFSGITDVAGMKLKRTLTRESVLTPALLTIPRMVKRGETITILAKSGSLSLHVKGKALMDGRRGDKIRVKNSRSKREIQATVISPGIVKVSM